LFSVVEQTIQQSSIKFSVTEHIYRRRAAVHPIRRNTMNSKSKLAAIALVAAVGVATPALAFAQALQTGSAANREQLYGSSPGQFVSYGRQADRANGLGAYARVPGSASVTGQGAAAGGSAGYNSHNETHN
jgi:hypothetical protein